MGLTLFYKHIIKPPIKDHLLTAILNQVGHERNGFGINRSAVKGCVEVLLCLKSEDVSVYKRDLEPRLLQESEVFYEKEGLDLVNSCDAPEFLRRVCCHSKYELNFHEKVYRSMHTLKPRNRGQTIICPGRRNPLYAKS